MEEESKVIGNIENDIYKYKADIYDDNKQYNRNTNKSQPRKDNRSSGNKGKRETVKKEDALNNYSMNY